MSRGQAEREDEAEPRDVEQHDHCKVHREEGGLDDVESHQRRGERGEGNVVLQGMGRPPVVLQEFRMDFLEGGEEVDGVVAAAEL